jgi:hypothetical protein
MTISLRLVETDNEIAKHINSALANRFNAILRQRVSNIAARIQQLIPSWIKSQPEMLSLLSSNSSSLVGQFGIYQDTNAIVNSIANSVAAATTIKTRQYTNNLKGGGLELNIQPNNFANLLGLPEGHTVYKDGDLHWLNWLLMRGDQIIVVGYEYNPQTGLGRSNLGNMKEGSSFRVPPQFSGTEDNNFITRALSGPEQEKEITKIFQELLGN